MRICTNTVQIKSSLNWGERLSSNGPSAEIYTKALANLRFSHLFRVDVERLYVCKWIPDESYCPAAGTAPAPYGTDKTFNIISVDQIWFTQVY